MVALTHRISAVSGISHFSPQLFASHTLKEHFLVGHCTLTECPYARHSGEDRFSGKTDWRPFKQAFSSSEIFQNQMIRTLRYWCKERSAVRMLGTISLNNAFQNT